MGVPARSESISAREGLRHSCDLVTRRRPRQSGRARRRRAASRAYRSDDLADSGCRHAVAALSRLPENPTTHRARKHAEGSFTRVRGCLCRTCSNTDFLLSWLDHGTCFRHAQEGVSMGGAADSTFMHSHDLCIRIAAAVCAIRIDSFEHRRNGPGQRDVERNRRPDVQS